MVRNMSCNWPITFKLDHITTNLMNELLLAAIGVLYVRMAILNIGWVSPDDLLENGTAVGAVALQYR
jgi:hypothetical protein